MTSIQTLGLIRQLLRNLTPWFLKLKNFFMNKLFILFSLVSTLSFHGHTQSIADLLIQFELDKEKLSSMKNTLQEMYQGYTELKQGYTRIRDIAKGNFNLHAAFLDALLAISPAVRSD